MSSSVFATYDSSSQAPQSDGSDFSENTLFVPGDVGDIQPLEGTDGQNVLEAFGIQEDTMNLPDEDRTNLVEVEQYVRDIIQSTGKSPTRGTFNRVLSDLRGEVGLDSDADPAVVLDRIAGVARGWKAISFITDPKEKRSILKKLAKQPSSSAMNKLVFEEMNRKEVWR